MTTENLPFSARNAQDFEQITESIESALKEIRSDPAQPATKSNLARLAGVHRNTLTFRARNSLINASHAEVLDINEGWPFSELRDIKKHRDTAVVVVHQEQSISKDYELKELQKRLKKARYVAGSWFHRTLQLKEELADLNLKLQRLADYSTKQESRIREGGLEIARLRDTIKKNFKIVE
ncbi:hypothetical protein A462_11655 [Pseudomonas sp. Ag1]|uniref:hypothetical protein n=1 Tax=Pseudomonas TaxID=286 RepID=UPI000272BD04|nr:MULTISPECIES: hypothetical protein [unclassified Pseudomonas]EJF71703.1 hypothetical protein A462_11655 [Pseudomonas sp. Ag1]